MRISRATKISSLQVVSAFFASLACAAPCVVPPVSEDAIAQFRSNPSALVAPGSDARTIEVRVSELAGTSAELATDIVNLAAGAPPRFRTAIAAGLAQAAIACNNTDQHAALQIQQAVAGYEDGQFQASFAAVAGDLSTAATEAAAESAVGAAGSVIIVNPNRSSRTTPSFGGGGSTPLVQITTGAATVISAGGLPTNPSNTTTTAANPVSPTR